MNQLEDKEVKIANGRCVINALASKKSGITKDKLLQCFIQSIDDDDDDNSHEHVQRELNRILAAGVESGIIVENCNKYALSVRGNVFVADGRSDARSLSDMCVGEDTEVLSVPDYDIDWPMVVVPPFRYEI